MFSVYMRHEFILVEIDWQNDLRNWAWRSGILAIKKMPSFLDIYLLYTEFTGFTMSLFTAILYRINRVLSLKSIPYISSGKCVETRPWI